MKNSVKKLLILTLTLLFVCAGVFASATEREPEMTDRGACGDLLKLELHVAEGATGPICYYAEAFTMPADFELQSGDTLCYDVMLLTEAGGIGGLDLYTGTGNNGVGDATLRDDVVCVDQEFLRCHPTVNIAGLAYNMWWSREVFITDTYVNASAGKDDKLLIAVDLPDASVMAGTTAVIYYDNIRIVRNGETVYTIFADRNNALPETPVYYLNLSGNNPNVEGVLSIEENEYTEPAAPTEPPVDPTDAPTEPAADPTDPPADPTEPVQEKPQNSSGLIIGIVAAVVVVAVVVVVVLLRKKK